MNESPESTSTLSFELNRKLDAGRLHAEFSEMRRLRIRNFLGGTSAVRLYRHLLHEVRWRTFLIANEKLLGTPPGKSLALSPEKEKEILDVAYDGARAGFACVFDADRLHPEDVEASRSETAVSTGLLATLESFFASAQVVEFFRCLTGLEGDQDLTLHVRALRLRHGQFISFHAGTWSADGTGKRRAMFYLNLTPEWRPEWGGTLEVRTPQGDMTEGYLPSFNTLDVLGFPQGHWITPVAPFAGGPVLCIAGRLCVR